MKSPALFLCGLLASSALAAANTHPLDEKSFEDWREFILPAPEELRWQEIPWHESFWKGLLQAQQQNRPLVLWAMNGHPLGCT